MTPLAEIFSAPFMQMAALALAPLALTAAVVGVALNLRELEFVSDGLVHSVFPGVVIGYVAGGGDGLGVYLGAIVATAVATVALTLAAHRGVGTDATTAVLLAGAFALGIVIVSRATNYATGLEQLLFGQLLTVSGADLAVITGLGVVAVALVAVTWKQQLAISFDRHAAAAAGIPVLRNELILNLAIALTVVSASRAVGNLLVLALLIVPAAVGRLLSHRLGWVMVFAAATALLASAAGLIAGYWLAVDARLRVSPSAVLVLALVACYLLAVAGSGLARRMRGARRLRGARREVAA